GRRHMASYATSYFWALTWLPGHVDAELLEALDDLFVQKVLGDTGAAGHVDRQGQPGGRVLLLEPLEEVRLEVGRPGDAQVGDVQPDPGVALRRRDDGRLRALAGRRRLLVARGHRWRFRTRLDLRRRHDDRRARVLAELGL